MYAYIDGERVYNVYNDISAYSEDFKSHCVEIPENVKVRVGYLYSSGEFICPNSFVSSTDNGDIEYRKSEKIAESKTALAEWLENNPYLHTDGKYYACTAEKQSLLNSNLASYERAKTIGVDYPLKWNSTGDECVEWEYTDLLTLSLSIAAYVAPKVAKQQNYELQIKACETTDEIYNIVINYDE